MREKVAIRGIQATIDENLERYIQRKIAKLTKCIPKEMQQSMHVDVYAKEIKTHGGKQCECEVILTLPKETLRVKEATVNMYAAIDIVEEKLRTSLIRHKEARRSFRRTRITDQPPLQA